MKNADEMVSIIVPIYNVEKYLEKCINSIMEQTYENLEILLINDGSTDKSTDLCYKYASIDSRIVVISKKNEGVSATRNRGIELAHGKWLMFLDGDDWLENDACEKLIYAAHVNDSDVCIGNFLYDYKNKTEIGIDRNLHVEIELGKGLIHNSILNYESKNYEKLCMPWGKLIKTDILRNGRMYFSIGIHPCEDLLWTLELFRVARKIIYINDVLVHYRMVGNSSTKSHYINHFQNDEKVLETMSSTLNISKDLINIYAIKCLCGRDMLNCFFINDKSIYGASKELRLQCRKKQYSLAISKVPYDKIKKFHHKTIVFFIRKRMYMFAMVVCVGRYYLKSVKQKIYKEKMYE